MRNEDVRLASQRAYEERNKHARRSNRHVHKSKMDHGLFCCVDGEGINVGDVFTLGQGKKGHKEQVVGHHYNMVGAYFDGEHFAAPPPANGAAYEFTELCDWLAGLAAICGERCTAMVGFGLSYDFTHMLRSLAKRKIVQLRLPRPIGRGVRIYTNDRVYVVDYRERRYLHVRIFADQNLLGPGGRLMKPIGKFRLWDVFGFFQTNFVDTLDKWLPLQEFKESRELVRTMKLKRGDFRDVSPVLIERYNRLEVELLSNMMTKLWTALRKVDLTLSRWDGAGAVAAAMFKKYDIKKHLRDTRDLDPHVFEAAKYAYAGGRAELLQVGFFEGAVHHYDLQSAYPAIMLELPSLAEGEWIEGEGEPPPGFTLVHVQWDLSRHRPYYPFPFRREDGSIFYPRNGETWVWYPEYSAALQWCCVFSSNVADYGRNHLEVVGWLHWKPATDIKPFAFIEPVFAERQRLKALGDDAEKVLKLGLNSLYGKMAQQIGARYTDDGELKTPPFFQLEYAGYITSGARARLLLAAMERFPGTAIFFATDGLFATRKRDVDLTTAKLGAWEYKCHASILTVLSGIYWYEDRGEKTSKLTRMTRGHPKEDQGEDRKQIDRIRKTWRKMSGITEFKRAYARFRKTGRLGKYWANDRTILVPAVQMISFGLALMQPALWRWRGCFRKTYRKMDLTGATNMKRVPHHPSTNPADNLVKTFPREHTGDAANQRFPVSTPYNLAWKDAAIAAGEWTGYDADTDNEDI